MKKWVVLLASGLGLGMLLTVQAGPAVLLRAYPVEVVRGNYLLGRRTARAGEAVKIDSLDGPKTKVLTLDGDALTVYSADLRLLPEDSPVLTRKTPPAAQAQPSATPSPTPLPSPALSLVPDIFGSPPPVQATDKAATAKADKTEKVIAERRATAVQCSCATKKGTRCTRMTKSPNGLCWQHGGD